MKPGTEKLHMWLVTESPAAVLVCDGGVSKTRELWLPRSLIDYLRITPPPQPGPRPSIEFTLPEWKINQANLWDFVIG